MKHWQLDGYGIDRLALGESEIPAPGPHDLLVKVAAVSLNYRDKMVIEGGYFPDVQFPFVPLSDAAGEVVAVGSGVTRFKSGDRVVTHFFRDWIHGAIRPAAESAQLGGSLPGVLAEYIVVPEHGAVATPEYLSDVEASTLPIAALTAWWALFQNRPLLPGETVLVQGTGGVSLFALQLASAFGARVIATSSSDGKLAKARELGAWATVNYRTQPDWDREVLALTEGRGVDHALEVVGGEGLQRTVNALARGGQVALVGFLNERQAAFDILGFMLKFASFVPVGVGHRSAFEAMNRALERLQIRPVVDAVYPFSEAKEALEHLERGPFGKVVIAR